MNEQKILRNQLFKFIKSNLLNLIIVFLLFGLFMIFLVRRITFSSANMELRENVRLIKKNLRNLESLEIVKEQEEVNEFQEYGILSSINNPKILCLIRDEDGEILSTNASYLSNSAFEDFDFDDEKIDKPYNVLINEDYLYKGIIIDISDV